MSGYPGKEYITRAMGNIVGQIMRPYANVSKKEDYESEEEFLFSHVTRWADERVLWHVAEQKVFLVGFPHWFQVAEEKATDEMNAALRPHVQTKMEEALSFVLGELRRFEADFGAKPEEAVVPGHIIRLLYLGNNKAVLEDLIKCKREEYGRCLILYSDEDTSRYRRIKMPETL